MKNLLAVSALVLAVAPAAMASKARVNSLNNSRHLVDIQTAFDRPYQFMALSTQATVEWGSNGDRTYDAVNNVYDAATTSRGEAGFLMKNDDMAWGVYFGRRSDNFSKVVTGFQDASIGKPYEPIAAGLMLEQNPINAFYASKMGDWTYGITAKYSAGKNDADKAKVSSAGLALGVSNGTIDVDLVQGLMGKTEAAIGANSVELESKGMTELTVGYHMNDAMEVYGKYGMLKVEGTIGGNDATITETNRYSVGFVHQLVKTEDMNFFYGVAYSATEDKEADTKGSALPVWMGVETKATENLVVRGSISQNVLINTEEDAAGDKADVDSLAMNFGLGYKLGKGMIDANLTSVQTGTLGFQDDLLSQVSYTFNF